MKEIELKYGCNPNQKPTRVYVNKGALPFEVLSGKPGYINFLDALNAWQLVREMKQATGQPSAASFKHVSPAGAAIGRALDEIDRAAFFVDDLSMSALSSAYARARGADRMSSFGDWAALSDICDEETALLLKREVSDGIIAPGYTDKALAVLKEKRKGGYNIVRIDPDYLPDVTETKQVSGVFFEQRRNDFVIDASLLTDIPTKNKQLSEGQKRDLLIALVTLKYTQSNSVCYVRDGQAIGVGAGQQSRIHCTRLAGSKADIWHLRRHPRVLALDFVDGIGRADRDNAIDVYISDDYEDLLADGVWQTTFSTKPQPLTRQEKAAYIGAVSGVALGSDAFFPFGDNIERARKSGVDCIVQPGGSIRDAQVIDTCDKYGIVMAMSGMRLFHH